VHADPIKTTIAAMMTSADVCIVNIRIESSTCITIYNLRRADAARIGISRWHWL